MRAAAVTIAILVVAGFLLYFGQPAWIPAAGYGQSVAIRIQSDSTPRVGQWEELGARIETGPWKRVPLLLAYGAPCVVPFEAPPMSWDSPESTHAVQWFVDPPTAELSNLRKPARSVRFLEPGVYEMQARFRFCETTYSPVLRVEVGGQ